uniref:Nck-associated protein 5 C-terminal domain-containing protein n=1 Tax=Astyanax mexicanus TaxID=7994 RepID=W5LRA6_ASTMX
SLVVFDDPAGPCPCCGSRVRVSRSFHPHGNFTNLFFFFFFFQAENAALAQANENQREAYERCLDEVSRNVGVCVLCVQDLREECIKLKMRVFDLERQNKTLSELFTQKLHSTPNPLHQVNPKPIILCTQNGTGGSAQASASSMEAMSPFLKKKAHILEVLRKLEESDPLKFHPSACYYYHGQAVLPGETTVVTPAPRQPHCRHSSSDSDIHEYANGEGAQDGRMSARHGGCPSCRVLSQRSSLDSLLRCSQAHSSREADTQGQKCSDEHRASAQSTDPQIEIDKTNQPTVIQSRASISSFSQSGTKASISYLSSLVADSSESHSKVGEEPKKSDFKDKDIKISPTKSKGANSGPQDSRQADTGLLTTRDNGADECRYLEVSGDSAICENETSIQVCNGVFSSNETSISKKVSLESYSPTTSAFAQQQQASGKGKFAHSPTSPPSSFSESKPSPVSSPSKLLKFLKIPSMAENTPAANALRLSPQLTRNSKIPCRNNYEVYQSPVMSRKATTAEVSKGANQASSQPPKGAPVPHYENILDPSASLSDSDTDTESPVWQRPQHHFSLPSTSSAVNKAQRTSYSSMKDRCHERGPPEQASAQKHDTSSPSQAAAKRSDRQPPLPKRAVSGKPQNDSSYHPFKERLAALGKLKSTEDLQQQAVDKREAQSNLGKTAAGNGERSKTAERHGERISMEQRHSKYTDSLDGKPYPKTSLGNYAKGPVSSSHEQSTKPIGITSSGDKSYIVKAEGQKIRMGMSSTASCETPVMMRSYAKCPNPLPHHSKTVPSPQSSPTRAHSKSPSKTGSASSSYPRGMKPVQDEHPHPQRHPSPESANIKTVEKRPSAASHAHQSAIEQKVMRGIEENMLKLQEQDRGQPPETKQKTSNGIASWFGLKKSKLPALNRKPETSKLKLNVSSSSSSSSAAKDASGAKGGPRKVVESLNISKLMEKAEDLRKALEEERTYVNRVGIALDRPGRGHSCEVVMDPSQGQLSLMYRGVTADNFMQQLLNRLLRAFLILLFSYYSPPGSGSSMRTLDSGIGTFPLPDYASSAAGKGVAKPQGDQGFFCSQGKQGALLKAPRKARTLERELSSLDEVNPCVLYGSPLEAKAPAVHLSSTIHEGTALTSVPEVAEKFKGVISRKSEISFLFFSPLKKFLYGMAGCQIRRLKILFNSQ